ADCDVLLVVGGPVFQVIFPEIKPPFAPGTKLLQIDLVSWELNKNVPADIAVVADPKEALKEIAELVRAGRTPAYQKAAEERRSAIAKRTAAARERRIQSTAALWDKVPISGPRLMKEIKDAAPNNALIFAEAISNQLALIAAFQP